jgi:hypothetical protein
MSGRALRNLTASPPTTVTSAISSTKRPVFVHADVMISFMSRAQWIYAFAHRGQRSKKFRGLKIRNCPFVNLPPRDKGRWGEGLTAEKNGRVSLAQASLNCANRTCGVTEGNHLRHSKFVAIR